jgi:hypothetical protein
MKATNKKLGVLIHGAGWISTQHIEAFKKNPHAQVVAISSRTVESARRRATAAGLGVPCFGDYRTPSRPIPEPPNDGPVAANPKRELLPIKRLNLLPSSSLQNVALMHATSH